jgi:hypothetical protein
LILIRQNHSNMAWYRAGRAFLCRSTLLGSARGLAASGRRGLPRRSRKSEAGPRRSREARRPDATKGGPAHHSREAATAGSYYPAGTNYPAGSGAISAVWSRKRAVSAAATLVLILPVCTGDGSNALHRRGRESARRLAADRVLPDSRRTAADRPDEMRIVSRAVVVDRGAAARGRREAERVTAVRVAR